MHLAQLGRQRRRRDAVADLPAGAVVGLAEARHDERARAQFRVSAAPLRARGRRRRCARRPRPTTAGCRCRAAARPARMSSAANIAPDGLCGELIISRRVFGVIAARDQAPVGREGRRVERHVHGAAAGQVDRRLVAVVARVEHDHFVARAAPPRRSRRRSPRVAPEVDGDLGVGVGAVAVAALGLGGDGLAQRRDAGHRRVLVVAVAHGAVERLDQRSGTSKSGKPWPRLTASCSIASCDMTVKMVVPTVGQAARDAGVLGCTGCGRS